MRPGEGSRETPLQLLIHKEGYDKGDALSTRAWSDGKRGSGF